ncbi:MAG TPA: 5-formyltetrahydrofolate cyclo-ligase [Hyphomicrobiaceae bacterium]|nr:5-formyltetrahydrofolate cyclo-ligase [Hyphomicrobiaceae bacterium]
MSQTILEQKRALRARAKSQRASYTAAHRAQAASAVADLGLGFLPPAGATATVSGFAPLADEFRLWPLLRRLAGEGMPLALPVIDGKGKPLLFRAWQPGDATAAGVWGIAEPRPDKPRVEPDILLVPLLAFDREGWRLGYGGGFYDRTLRGLRAHKLIVAVGIAFDEQRVDAVPHLDYDERLDWVLTPSGPIRCVG